MSQRSGDSVDEAIELTTEQWLMFVEGCHLHPSYRCYCRSCWRSAVAKATCAGVVAGAHEDADSGDDGDATALGAAPIVGAHRARQHLRRRLAIHPYPASLVRIAAMKEAMVVDLQ